MKLREVALRLSEEQAGAISVSRPWAGETEVVWPEALLDDSRLARIWPRLTASMQRTMTAVIRRFGPAPFSEEQLLAAIPPDMPGLEARFGLMQLQRAGILFAVRKSWGEKRYALPRDTFCGWWRTIAAGAIEPAVLEEEDVRPGERSGGPAYGLQLLHMLAELYRCGTALTSKGVLPKRTIDKCAAQLAALSEEELSFLAPMREDVPYPSQLVLALDIAGKHGWLMRGTHTLSFKPEALERWLALTPAARESELMRDMMEQYILSGSEPARAAAALSLMPVRKWCSLDGLADALLVSGTEESEQRVKERLVMLSQILTAFGWMETGSSACSGETAARWLIDPPGSCGDPCAGGEAAVRAAPDGELFVPPDVPGTTIWALEMIAERKRADLFAVYRLTERSVRSAASYGYEPAKLIEMLETMCGEPLPETLRFALDGWLAAAAESHIPAGAGSADDQECPFTQLLDSSALNGYDLIAEPPSLGSLLRGGLEEVPAVWTRQLRAYHPSTCRELLEKALSWRSAVKLNREGDVQLFIPEKLEEQAGTWAVTGRLDGSECATLQPHMWQEMMIVIPMEQ
ncbi:helicase-associated domain-containing protein [Paenibacillus humicola]|uniref:helicase-associated domain-containing protein n=1 Tax=Paenibacillus humicola TaxID=3110540 RepID=UPI00237BDFD8|nr:helicase-associated domain-containing protein [Paenibacillus humicola]